MVNIDVQNGIATYAPPALAAGEVAARVAGLTINEWFYIAAIVSMAVSTGVSAYVSIRKSKREEKESNEQSSCQKD